MLQGVPPYQLAGNMKFPGTYGAYAIIMAAFGQTPAGIHLGVLGTTALTAGMLFWLGRRLLDETAGLVAAGAYSVLAASPTILGLEGHAAHFVALFATAGLCLLLPVRGVIGWKRALAGGFMLGMALLMIQHGLFFCLWGLILLAVARPRPPGMVHSKRLPLMAAYGLGVMLPLGLTGLLLWHAGVLGRFWFWTISYARQYVSLVPLADVPMKFLTGFSQAVGGNALTLAGSATAGMAVCPDWFCRGLLAGHLPRFLFSPALFSFGPAGRVAAGRLRRQRSGIGFSGRHRSHRRAESLARCGVRADPGRECFSQPAGVV
jgi:hypothetical protein